MSHTRMLRTSQRHEPETIRLLWLASASPSSRLTSSLRRGALRHYIVKPSPLCTPGTKVPLHSRASWRPTEVRFPQSPFQLPAYGFDDLDAGVPLVIARDQ